MEREVNSVDDLENEKVYTRIGDYGNVRRNPKNKTELACALHEKYRLMRSAMEDTINIS